MTEEEYSRGMELARQAKQTMVVPDWVALVQAARELTMDAMSLDDLPAAALALARMKRLQSRVSGISLDGRGATPGSSTP